MAAKDRRFQALDRAISTEGAKIVLLVRLAVIFPFTYTNYVFGLTGVRLLPYALATLVGIIPGSIAFVYIGAAAAAATTGTVKLVVYIAGAVLALIASAFVARVAVKAIHRAGIRRVIVGVIVGVIVRVSSRSTCLLFCWRLRSPSIR